MNNFLQRFQPILEIYWRNKQVDLSILTHPRLANPIENLANVINLFKEYKRIFSSQIPKQADIGLIQLNSQSARETIQPTPEAYIKEIEKHVPIVIK